MRFSFEWIKAAVTLATAVLMALIMAIGAGSFSDLTTQDWVETAILFLTGSVVVGILDNVPGVFGGVIKAVVGAAVAGLTAWQVAFENDHIITQGELLTIALAVVTGLSAVYQIPDAPPPPNGNPPTDG